MAGKYYRTVLMVEILSEGAPVGNGMELDAVAHEIKYGDRVGSVTCESELEVTEDQMHKLLERAGSFPEFFEL